jgi:flagellar basal body-associated protein FliL
MEQNNQTQEPIISETEMKMPEENFGAVTPSNDRTTHLGIILGILIVLLVLILGGLYMWGSTLSTTTSQEVDIYTRPTPEENNEPESTTAEAEVETLGALSNSTDLGAIEADIESTNLDTLDSELNAIDAELDAALQSI